MSVRRALVASLLLLAVPGTAAFGPGPLSDPGGGDASDDRADPTILPGPGHYNGSLIPVGDADWYALNPEAGPDANGEATCLEVTASGPANARLNVTMDGSGARYYAAGNLTPDRATALGLAVPAFQGSTIGLAPLDDAVQSAGTYGLELSKVDVDEAASTDPQVDGSLELDRPCLVSTLDAGAFLERTVNATPGDELIVSLAQATSGSVRVTLTDANGTERGQIGAGRANITHLTADTAGNWTITATNLNAESSAQFALGVSVVDDCQAVCFVEDPEEEEEENGHCSPYCFLAGQAEVS